MKARRYKVMEQPRKFGQLPASHIRFRGYWLKPLGFTVGSRFTAHSPAHGILVLRVVDEYEPAPDPAFLQALNDFAKVGL